jgi:putative DNA primase/helicase
VTHPDDGWTVQNEPTKNNVIQLGREVHTGQLRMADRFVSRYADELLFIHKIGWHTWSGTHWVEDEDGRARRLVKDLLYDTWQEIAALEAGDHRKTLMADVRKCESAGGISGVLDVAKVDTAMTCAPDRINQNPFLFNATNGTLNLLTGELQKHNPRDLITKVAGADIDPDARSDLFDTFLAQVLPDAGVREYLQRVLGHAMLGLVREHTLPILTGIGGNGKGVLYETALASFGDYGMALDPKILMKSNQERHGTFLADLHGARLVIASETEEGKQLDASLMKRLTGGDRIRTNRMRMDTFEFAPSHSLLYVTNHKPKVAGDDSAVWRRLTVVPFDVVVPPDRRDGTLGEKLRGELAAVLAWIFRGWKDYERQGLNPPAAVLASTSEYRTESDLLGRFLDEACVSTETARVQASDLFRAWQHWSIEQGGEAISQTDFGKKIAARGYAKGQNNKGRNIYKGLGLRSHEETQGVDMFAQAS